MEEPLKVIIGPMFAGKTKTVLALVEQLDSVVLISHGCDTRYGESEVVSHDGDRLPCVAVDKLDTKLVKGARVVVIDEGQFFTDLEPFVLECLALGKQVVVAGLDLLANGKPFGDMLKLAHLPESSVTYLQSKCSVCNEAAPFSECLDGQGGVGGADRYEPRCAKHFSGDPSSAYKVDATCSRLVSDVNEANEGM